MKILIVLLFSSLLLTGCSTVEAQSVNNTIVSKEVIEIESDEIPTYEEILFAEVPDSRSAVRDFLSFISAYDLRVKHVSIRDYTDGNFTLNTTFDNADYSINIYVRNDEDKIVWFGNLLKNKEFISKWEYKEYNDD